MKRIIIISIAALGIGLVSWVGVGAQQAGQRTGQAEQALQKLQQMLAKEKAAQQAAAKGTTQATKTPTQAQKTAAASATSTTKTISPELQKIVQRQQQQRQAQPTTTTTPTTTGAQAVASAGSTPSGIAFTQLLQSTLPLSPEQIAELRMKFEDAQRAAATVAGTPPKPVTTTRVVDLSPGATPPLVRLSSGFISSLAFIDASGSPWPIQSYDLGDPNSFNIAWDKKGNILMIQALSGYKSGNLAVLLKGLNTPVLLTLIPGQSAVDYRVDFRIPGLGPNAKSDYTGLPSSANPLLLNVLNGIPPLPSCSADDGPCQPVKVVGGKADAWLLFNKLYVRTPLTIVSPGYISTMSSPDGTHAYTIPQAPILIAMQHGKTIQLMVKEG